LTIAKKAVITAKKIFSVQITMESQDQKVALQTRVDKKPAEDIPIIYENCIWLYRRLTNTLCWQDVSMYLHSHWKRKGSLFGPVVRMK